MTRHRCAILQFPIDRVRKPAPPPAPPTLEPRTVRLDHDDGEWCVTTHVGTEHENGRCFYSADEARAAVARLVEEGYELLPPLEAAATAGARL